MRLDQRPTVPIELGVMTMGKFIIGAVAAVTLLAGVAISQPAAAQCVLGPFGYECYGSFYYRPHYGRYWYGYRPWYRGYHRRYWRGGYWHRGYWHRRWR